MEEYDVLGNFKNMKNIFKNAMFQKPEPPKLPTVYEDADSLVETETSPKSLQTNDEAEANQPIKSGESAQALEALMQQEQKQEEAIEDMEKAPESEEAATFPASVKELIANGASMEEIEKPNQACEEQAPMEEIVSLNPETELTTSKVVETDLTVDGVENVREHDKKRLESPMKAAKKTEPNLLDFYDDLNPEMSIKILWQFKLQTFKLRKYQKFLSIFEQLAKNEGVEVEQIFLNLDYRIIKPADTPASIDYKIYQFIEGRAMSSADVAEEAEFKVSTKPKRDPNHIKLKVQSNKFKQAFWIELLKTENFQVFAIKCAEELKVSSENIVKLCFDGENLSYEQTPIDLELEGGEIIEIYLKD